jgi:NAD(P)-dependent dehydrogenase (short-subunit alcohol dehydrogenase family)
MRDYSGKVAMVGGAVGVGRAVSLLLARKGAKVAVVDRVEQAASELAAEIRARGGEAESWRMDQDGSESDQVFSEVREAFGAIDMVVHTASLPEPAGTRAKAVRYLNPGGRIINLSPMLSEGKGKAVYGRVSRRRGAGK